MKTCGRCNKEKALEDFAWRNKSKGTKQPYCKPCRKEIDAKRYSESETRRKSIKDNRKALRERNLDYVRSYLVSHPCVDCGFEDIRCLDFDHLRDKSKNVSLLARVPVSLENLKIEIEKCEVRCANCHRITTYERAGWTYASMV